MDKKELNSTAPPEVRLSVARIETGTGDLNIELFRLARQGYLFIGGVVHKEQHEPQAGINILDMERTEWRGVSELGKRAVVATDLGEVAICAALFGNLNDRDERASLGVPIVGHGPPFYGFETTRYSGRERSPSGKTYDVFATPQLINVAQLMGPALKGYIDIVSDEGFTLTHSVRRNNGTGGIYTADQDVQTIVTIEIDGTDLPPNIQPRNFPKILPPLDLEY